MCSSTNTSDKTMVYSKLEYDRIVLAMHWKGPESYKSFLYKSHTESIKLLSFRKIFKNDFFLILISKLSDIDQSIHKYATQKDDFFKI